MAADEADQDDVDTEEEQVEREWHLWLIALVFVGGIGLYVAPPDIVPGLVRGLAPLLILVAVVGWVTKVIFQRWA